MPTLYLTCGVLGWREAAGVQAVYRSMALLPATLERPTPLAPFTLAPCDEEPLANPALRKRIRLDFQVELPDWKDDRDDPETYRAEGSPTRSRRRRGASCPAALSGGSRSASS
jgi:hypothetical protein